MVQKKPDASQIDSDVQSHIGRQLRSHYVDILSQPVPDRFLDLLAELDRKEIEVAPPSNDDDRAQNGVR
jgi:hypothetical protein